MKKLLLILIISVITKISNAQEYATGIGIRLGGLSSGITVKHFTNSTNALEGIVSFGRRSFRLTGLWEKHAAFPNAPGLTWFYGLGAHIAFYNDDYGYSYYRYYKNRGNSGYFVTTDYNESNISLGPDFIIGLDYKFKNAPVDLGLDIKPFMDIIPGIFGYWEGALSVRFTL